MQDQPNPVDILQGVAAFLREQVMPKLEGQTAFHTRVVANALDIVARQWELAPEAEAREHVRLRELLARDGERAQLNDELCRRIEQGDLTLDTPGLADHLWQITLDKLAVDQPRYETYKRLRASQP